MKVLGPKAIVRLAGELRIYMTNNPMSRLNIIKQSEKDHYETLSEFDLRLLMQEYVETKRYLHASYLSRLIIRKRVNAKGELIKAKGGIEV